MVSKFIQNFQITNFYLIFLALNVIKHLPNILHSKNMLEFMTSKNLMYVM